MASLMFSMFMVSLSRKAQDEEYSCCSQMATLIAGLQINGNQEKKL